MVNLSVKFLDELKSVFERFGAIHSAYIIKDHLNGQNKDFAYVEFKEASAALSSVNESGKLKIGQNKVEISLYREHLVSKKNKEKKEKITKEKNSKKKRKRRRRGKKKKNGKIGTEIPTQINSTENLDEEDQCRVDSLTSDQKRLEKKFKAKTSTLKKNMKMPSINLDCGIQTRKKHYREPSRGNSYLNHHNREQNLPQKIDCSEEPILQRNFLDFKREEPKIVAKFIPKEEVYGLAHKVSLEIKNSQQKTQNYSKFELASKNRKNAKKNVNFEDFELKRPKTWLNNLEDDSRHLRFPNTVGRDKSRNLGSSLVLQQINLSKIKRRYQKDWLRVDLIEWEAQNPNNYRYNASEYKSRECFWQKNRAERIRCSYKYFN